MIPAAINYLSISINLLLVIFVVVCLLMTLLILMQRPKQEGLGAAFGAGVTDQVFGARTTNVLQRGTVYLGSMFFVLSMTLAILIGMKNKQLTLLTPAKPVAAKVEEAKIEIPAEPKSLADELPTPAPVTSPVEAPADAPVPQIPADPAPVTPAPEIVPADPAPVTPAPEIAPEAVPTEIPAPTPEKP